MNTNTLTDIAASVLSISASENDFKKCGTGFVVRRDDANTYVVTCAHVVNKNARIQVSTADGAYTADLLESGADHGIDMAVLRIREVLDNAPLLMQPTGTPGLNVRVVGFRRLNSTSLTRITLDAAIGRETTIVENSRECKAWELLVTDGTLVEGCSGAPVVDVASGRVVGIAVLKEGNNLGLALGIENLVPVWSDFALTDDGRTKAEFWSDRSCVERIHSDALETLNNTLAVMKGAAEILGAEEFRGKYPRARDTLSNEITKVDNLELVMAIVAPMKAGKSTVINSIIGRELLPTRNTAMTSIPTAIVLDSGCSEPLMELSSTLVSSFQKAVEELKSARTRSDFFEKIKTYPDLILFATGDHLDFQLENIVRGRDKIYNALIYMNDLARLCAVLGLEADPINDVNDLPRIRTAFWNKGDTSAGHFTGHLVIIDTPGPNESRATPRLNLIVNRQLQSCSLVLMVLDFTSLRCIAEEDIKREVDRITEIKGNSAIYVLVNKIDQRRAGDMSSEDAVEFVRAKFSLQDCSQVFEVSARWAFVYVAFLLELNSKRNADVPLRDWTTVTPMARELFPTDWEDELREITLEKLERKAKGLWDRSQFGQFLDVVTCRLMADVAPRAMRSAAKTALRYTQDLMNDASLRSNAMAQDAVRLESELKALQGDIADLEKRFKAFKADVENATQRLRNKIGERMNKLRKDAFVDYRTVYEVLKGPGSMSAMLSPDLSGINFLTSLTLKVAAMLYKSALGRNFEGCLRFDDATKAEEFAEQAFKYSQGAVADLVIRVRAEVEAELLRARESLIQTVQNNTQAVIKRARDRINKAFDVNLALPLFSLDQYTEDIPKPEKLSIDEQTEFVPGETITRRTRPWWTLWLVEIEEKVPGPMREEKYFTYSVAKLVEDLNKSIETSIWRVKAGVDEYVKMDLEGRVQTFCSDLGQYLRGYQSNLQKAQGDAELSCELRNNILERLKQIHGIACSQKLKIEAFLRRLTLITSE